MNRAIRKTLHIIINGFFALAVLIVASAAVMAFMHLKPVAVVSGSMEPVIHTGSFMIIDTTYRDVKKRDIIAFETGGILVTHRVIEVVDNGYVTKGDANEKADPGRVDKTALKGRAVMWVPWIGYAVKFMTSISGIILLTAVCIGLLLLYSIPGKGVRSNDSKKHSDFFDSHTA